VDHESSPSAAAASPEPSLRIDADAFRLLIEGTTDYAIFMLDPDGYVASWNEGAQRMKGYRSHEIIGKHFSIFYPPEAVERDWPGEELRRAVAHGRLEDEGWRLRKDGSRFWANVVITPLRNKEGRLLGFGKVSRDLTERRRAEQQLRDSEERFRLMVESTVDYAIFLLDPDGRVISWNAGAQRIKGYTAEEITGSHFSVFYTTEALARRWPEHELEVAAKEGRFEDNGWRVRKDGSRFWANVVITALRGADGTLRGFAKVTRDMSERKAHEERIEKLTRELRRRVEDLAAVNDELRQKSAENESFVYSVSHDLRSPLVNLQGFSQELSLASGSVKTLLSNPAVPEEIRRQGLSLLAGDLEESITYIRNAVQHLGNIIDGLLRLSRAGRVEYDFEPVHAGAVAADVLSAMHGTVLQSGARIELRPLPTVRADRNALGQVFANLIGNALKSLDPERPGVVEIRADGADPPVFVVRDNGVGIPLEYQPKIFQVFQHVRPGPAQGEGMGLAIVHRIVERHGGRIWFESAPGVGTTFYFSLGHAAPQAASPSAHDGDRQ
jgi:PAS domain S-box-containing protein